MRSQNRISVMKTQEVGLMHPSKAEPERSLQDSVEANLFSIGWGHAELSGEGEEWDKESAAVLHHSAAEKF